LNLHDLALIVVTSQPDPHHQVECVAPAGRHQLPVGIVACGVSTANASSVDSPRAGLVSQQPDRKSMRRLQMPPPAVAS
jgi:hypothetical protein